MSQHSPDGAGAQATHRCALTFTVEPGSEPDSGYVGPAGGGAPDGLRRTTVALSGDRVVWVMEVEGDLTHPEHSRLERVQDRATPRHLLPPEGQATGEQVVLCLPVRPGCGPDAARRLARVRDLTPDVPTTVARTTIFAGGDVVVWVVDVAGDPGAALDGLAATAVRSGAVSDLARFVDAAHEVTTRPGFRRLLADCTMRTLTERRMEVPT